MLRDEHRMPAHGCLLAVVFRFGRCKPLGDEICRMVSDCIPAFLADVLLVLRLQMKAAAEIRARKPHEHLRIGFLPLFVCHYAHLFL